MTTTTNVREAAKALRAAQRAYMANRGSEAHGKAVAVAAEVLDAALAATEPAMGDVNKARHAYDEAWRGPAPGDSMRKALEAVNFPALKAAGLRLYMAGKWSCSRPVNEARLWEDFRDALGLRPGTATRARIHDDEPPLPFDRYAHADGSRECRPVPEAGPRIATSPFREVAEASVPDRPGVEL